MTMYTSKTPRDLNRDPMPWRNPVGNSRLDRQFHPGWWHDPRPAFDHVQHNEPNPILAIFRRDVQESGLTLVQTAASWDDDNYLDLFDAGVCSAKHMLHARKVLTRLARFASTHDT